MPILLNKERVAAEVMELARIKISAMLNVPIEMVRARWEHEEGKPPTPAFDVDLDRVEEYNRTLVETQHPPVTNEDEIRRTMGAVWRWLRDSLKERLEGLGRRRGQC